MRQTFAEHAIDALALQCLANTFHRVNRRASRQSAWTLAGARLDRHFNATRHVQHRKLYH
jgi:hypothetical protein